MLITPAFAQDAAGTLSTVTQFAPLVLIFAVFYFLLIRPQQTKQKEMEGDDRGDQARRSRGHRRRHLGHGAAGARRIGTRSTSRSRPTCA